MSRAPRAYGEQTLPPWLTAWLGGLSVPLAVLSQDGRQILAANAAARRLLALPAGVRSDTGAPWWLFSVIGRDATVAVRQHLRADPVGGPDDWLALRFRTTAGPRLIAFSLRRLPEGGWLATLKDRTPAGLHEGSRITWGENIEALANWLPVGVEIYDRDLRELFSNTHSYRVFDYAGTYFGHHSDWWALGFTDPAARAAAMAEWQAKVEVARRQEGAVQVSEWTVRCSDGSDRTMQFRYRFLGDYYIVVFWDVTEQRQLEAELRRSAATDALTGLPNRRAFMQAATRVGAAPGDPRALLLLDLDHFKSINDRFGHAVGDRALQETAGRCRRVLRDDDQIARIGGEEFAVLLPSTSLDGARMVADRLHDAIRRAPYALDPHRLEVRACVGGAYATAETGIDVLFERADRALYAAKSRGRDRVVFDAAFG